VRYLNGGSLGVDYAAYQNKRRCNVETTTVLQTTAGLLAISAVGGLIMALIRFSGKPRPPSWLAMLHGFLSAAALTLLIYAAVTIGLPQLAQAALILFLLAASGGVVLNLNYHLKMLPLPKWWFSSMPGSQSSVFYCYWRRHGPRRMARLPFPLGVAMKRSP
jgi:ABC-type amino acid transport system permease subunit